MKDRIDTVPRRNRLDLNTKPELNIYNCIQEIETTMPADVRLTDAINLLTQAREYVAEFVDSKEGLLWQISNANPV